MNQLLFFCQGCFLKEAKFSFRINLVMTELVNYFNNDPWEVSPMNFSHSSSVDNLEPNLVDLSCFGIPWGCEPQYARNASFRRYYSSFEKPTSIAFIKSYFYFAPACVICRINFDFLIPVVNFITDFIAKCVI